MSDRPRSALIGAAFLMATSAIGPGFLTQTAVCVRNPGPIAEVAIRKAAPISAERGRSDIRGSNR